MLYLLDVASEKVVAPLHSNGKFFLVVIKERSVWHDDEWYLVSEGC